MIDSNRIQRPKLVLVVDDHEINRDVLELILEDYDIVFAENGKEALRIMQEREKDLSIVLLDLMMPIMSGFEVLEFVKNAGMLGLGGAGFPTYVKYLKPENVELFIVNAVECEPYLTADYKNIEENIDLLKTGTLALYKLSKAKKGCVAIKEDKKEVRFGR